MKTPPKPHDEEQRLRALREYNILDSLPEQLFDDLTQLASEICQTPIALVSLVDEERQWFKSKVGLDASETPRDVSFCGHAVSLRELLVVDDATKDERFWDNPLVVGGPEVRFYAGAPLVIPTGEVLGTLCVIDRQPRSLSEKQRDALQALSRQVVAQLELRKSLQHAQEQSLRHKVFFDTSLDLLCTAGFDGYFKEMNPAWSALLGYTTEELVSQPFLNFIHPDDIANTQSETAALARGERNLIGFTNRFFCKDGSCRWLQWSAGVDLERQLFIAAARDITAQRQHEESLRLAKEVAESANKAKSAFFNVSLDLLCIAGFDGYFKELNPAWSKLLGYTREELSAQPFLSFVHEDDQANTQSEAAILATGQRDTIGFINRYRCKDGSYRWLQWSASMDAERQILIAAARDITIQRQHEESLRLAKESAESANKAKSAFLANMSHELRTPLNSVIGFVNVLIKNKAGNLREQDLSYLGRILANGKHLLSLLNDILDHSKIEAGYLELELEPIDTYQLVSECASQLEGDARARGLSLSISLPTEPAQGIIADRRRLKQILMNLLGNALKFTTKGGVEARVKAQGGEPLRIEISDNGVGIPPEKLSSIFEAFQQADTSTSRQYGGTGLGLTISQSLAASMGFSVEVASEVNNGSTFSVRLSPKAAPLVHTPPQRNETPQIHVQEIIAKKNNPKNVLLVDQNNLQQILEPYLHEQGGKIHTVSSLEKAKEVARLEPPSLLILDLLSQEGGWATLRKIQEDSALRDVPVLVCSATPDGLQLSQLGVIEVIEKPLEEQQLAELVRRYLGLTRRRVLIVDDDDDSRQILARLAISVGYITRTAHNGKEALDVLQIERPDLILLDLMMPVMDGFSFLSALRSQANGSDLPVVVCTAKELTQHERAIINEKAQYVLSKGSLNEDSLRLALKPFLEKGDS